MGRVSVYVRDAYCLRAQDYIRYRRRNGTHAEDLLAPIVTKALTRLGNAKSTILDLGCGCDPVMALMKGRHYIGLDLSTDLIKRHPLYGTAHAEFHRVDIRLCRFGDFAYQIVNGTLILNYIRDPARLIQRLRRPGKAFCFSVPNAEYDRKYGTLDGNGVISLVMNGHKFVYYCHSLSKLCVALGKVRELNIVYAQKIADGIPPFYACLYGRW